VLAATLSSNYGIYGPAFELLEHHPREHGSEEYASSEKYELRSWDLKQPDSLRHFIRRVNEIRRENAALHRTQGIVFHQTTNEMLLAYSKRREGNTLLCIVNLDPRNTQSGWVDLRMDELGLDWNGRFTVHDLLSDARYGWAGQRNYIELNPHVVPAHIFRIEGGE
jgi:starch synthase (maltosyl-transferring)